VPGAGTASISFGSSSPSSGPFPHSWIADSQGRIGVGSAASRPPAIERLPVFLEILFRRLFFSFTEGPRCRPKSVGESDPVSKIFPGLSFLGFPSPNSGPPRRALETLESSPLEGNTPLDDRGFHDFFSYSSLSSRCFLLFRPSLILLFLRVIRLLSVHRTAIRFHSPCARFTPNICAPVSPSLFFLFLFHDSFFTSIF